MTAYLIPNAHFLMRATLILIGGLLIVAVLMSAFNRAHNPPRPEDFR